MYVFLNVEDAKKRLIYDLSIITGFKYLKSGTLKKTINDIVFEINFFSSKYNTSGRSIEINAELKLIYKKFGKLGVDNVVASMFYTPTEEYWYDISTERKLVETRDALAQQFKETVMDLVKRFEDDYESAIQYLFVEGFEKYKVYLDFIADKLGQSAIKEKAQQIYDRLTNKEKEQVVLYQNGVRDRSWMINRCNLKYIIDNKMFE